MGPGSPIRTAEQSASDEDKADLSPRDRQLHPDVAPIAFIDSYTADLVVAADFIDLNELDLAIGKLKLTITLLGCIRAERGE